MSADARVAIHLLPLKCGPPLDKPSSEEIKLAKRIANILKDFEAHQLEVDEDLVGKNPTFDLMAKSVFVKLDTDDHPKRKWSPARQMGKLKFERRNVVVKNASGSSMKIHEKLRREFRMKGRRAERYAYKRPVSPGAEQCFMESAL
ncbi:unnamed protein product [Heligmosomoides polygyrus]|uniref:Ribosome biogenesis regulatory protein n=1 Tax=Heligmosomoides polygyrus TaxID=6339 RepID=A0A183G5W4_HELPZ|nr:unnamed protein product [Heligmosomoides polygyrus]